MKKIILLAIFFASTGILSSCTKENDVNPTSISKKLGDDELNKNNLGSGDGSRPSHD